MIDTCVQYGKQHGLTFSTDSNPKKCKTKCIAFLNKKRTLKGMELDGKELPWVNTSVHLGNRISNDSKGMRRDVMEKRAAYVSKNNELRQELHYAHPKSLVKVNNIYRAMPQVRQPTSPTAH